MSGVRLLTPADIPQAMALKDAVGWNQTAGDWRRVLELAPQGCFGIEREGRLAATLTTTSYGRDLAWIGMVITAPEFRGCGLATRLLGAAISFLDDRQTRWIKLDATSMGSGLYRKFGFADERLAERWVRAPAPAAAVAVEGIPGQWDAQLDRQVFGADRSALLAKLAPIESVSIPGAGYAMGRPGSHAAYFGPCIARGPREARALLQWFLSRHADQTIYWDLLPENREAVDLARGCRFERSRDLIRMARSSAREELLHTRPGNTYAIAGFEFG